MIVTVEWLREHIEDENVRIIDCRFDLANPNWGREKYEEGHIPHALYFDLNLDLSSPIAEHGGAILYQILRSLQTSFRRLVLMSIRQ